MVPRTSVHHPGHCRIAVRAQLRRWDVRLSGAPCQWSEVDVRGIFFCGIFIQID